MTSPVLQLLVGCPVLARGRLVWVGFATWSEWAAARWHSLAD